MPEAGEKLVRCMYINNRFLISLILLLAVWAVSACAKTENNSSMGDSKMVAVPTTESWLILPDVPETATQVDKGAEIYRLVCQDCHGDRGQGLTKEWRATWDPPDQNCWQSKCHASNHLPEGFILPRYVPPLLGPGSLANFETGLDLYHYIRIKMPWHQPGSLQDWEYMQLVAYLARERQLSFELPLEEAGAEKLVLNP